MRDHIDSFCERGLAFPELFDEIDDFRETIGAPSCAVSFQLPYPLDLDFSDYVGRGNRSETSIHLRFIPCVTEIDQRARRKTHRTSSFAKEDRNASDLRDCMQCIALMPLWGTRLQYYQKYVDLSERGLDADVVIPRENKPYTYSLSGAITVRMFELELSKRTISEAAGATRRFLRDYMALSLHEVEIPDLLYSPIASPREDRYFPLGDSPDLFAGMLSRAKNRALRRVSREGMERAAKWPARSFSPFEGQILALKRLSDDGEPELALVGLMALVEWLLKDSLPTDMLSGGKRKNGAFEVFQKAQGYFELSEKVWLTLHSARRVRNGHVHEKPTSRSQSYDPASVRYNNPETAKIFDDAAFAAFELFRAINRSRSSASKQNSNPA